MSANAPTHYVLRFDEIDPTQSWRVGGKAAHLAELARIADLRVPDGFCVTTDAYRRVLTDARMLGEPLARIARLTDHDPEAIRELSAEIRAGIAAAPIAEELAAAISRAHARLDAHADAAYAVRSSATAEDLPTASFAGQHDSYLHVRGSAALIEHVRLCWASLFTDRAVAYRMHGGIDHRTVHMAVVVQRMVDAEAAGVLFTADPVTGNRKVASVEAVIGLGDALVSGRVAADGYKVRGGTIVARVVAPAPQPQPVLTDAQVVRLVELCRRIEAHLGSPQDVEWCLADGEFRIVQSRPITTLFPIPAAPDDANRVYVSVGHQQMMTDPMKPLGLSMWQLTAMRPMAEAGGRLFVDVTDALASPASRLPLLDTLGRSDPLIRDALQTVLDRGNFITSRADEGPAWAPPGTGSAELATDPAIVEELIARNDAATDALARDISGRTGVALIDFIVTDVPQRRRIEFDPRSLQAVMAGIEAARWLNERLREWLGERNAADVLAQSAPNNVTSAMGLALLDVADAIRPHPEVVAFLERVDADGFLDALPTIPGGREARDAIERWLDRYGMRGVGEIDITRPRWSERPTMLLPALLAHVRHFAPGEAARRLEQGRAEALKKEQDVLERLRGQPGGEEKAAETKRMIDRLHTFVGYREYPKYGMVRRFFIYKQALLGEAERLVQAGVLHAKEDAFYLRLEELRDVVRTGTVDYPLVRKREAAFRSYASLMPPRVLTSEGEAVAGSYRREDLPPGALVGLAVSAGTVEGRARVVLDPSSAAMEPGDILVTRFTDPSWTPLFVTIAGLVTEVGGLTTHGAVIAREYGLPAVVGVGDATRLIRDGQQIRVNGTDGNVELLS